MYVCAVSTLVSRLPSWRSCKWRVKCFSADGDAVGGTLVTLKPQKEQESGEARRGKGFQKAQAVPLVFLSLPYSSVSSVQPVRLARPSRCRSEFLLSLSGSDAPRVSVFFLGCSFRLLCARVRFFFCFVCFVLSCRPCDLLLLVPLAVTRAAPARRMHACMRVYTEEGRREAQRRSRPPVL